MNDSTDHTALSAAGGRADIVATIGHYFQLWGDNPQRAGERAEAMVAYYDKWARQAHAHELAEVQRAHAAAEQKDHFDRHGCDDHEVDMCAEAVREAADLIDPQQQPDDTITVRNAAGAICIVKPPKEQPRRSPMERP